MSSPVYLIMGEKLEIAERFQPRTKHLEQSMQLQYKWKLVTKIDKLDSFGLLLLEFLISKGD